MSGAGKPTYSHLVVINSLLSPKQKRKHHGKYIHAAPCFSSISDPLHGMAGCRARDEPLLALSSVDWERVVA
jgi:hypothetical protein